MIFGLLEMEDTISVLCTKFESCEAFRDELIDNGVYSVISPERYAWVIDIDPEKNELSYDEIMEITRELMEEA